MRRIKNWPGYTVIRADSSPGPSDCGDQHPTSNVYVETKPDDVSVPFSDPWREERHADAVERPFYT